MGACQLGGGLIVARELFVLLTAPAAGCYPCAAMQELEKAAGKKQQR